MKKRKTKVCANCHTEFEKPRHVNKVNWAKMQFCSMPCYGAFKKKRILLPCDYCGKESEVKQANKNRYKRHFCDADCYALFQKHLMPKEEHGRFGKGELSEQEQIKRRRARSILNHHLRGVIIIPVYECNYCKMNNFNIHCCQNAQ